MILLDTNVLSEPLKPTPNPRVVAWLDREFADSAISTITIFELLSGAVMLDVGRRRAGLESAIASLVRRFGPHIYGFDVAAARAAASLLENARTRGLGLHQLPAKLADLQVAGIAAANGLSLATRNTSDFQGLGLSLIDPWKA